MTTYYETRDGRYFGEDSSFYEFDLNCLADRKKNLIFLYLLFLYSFHPSYYFSFLSDLSRFLNSMM